MIPRALRGPVEQQRERERRPRLCEREQRFVELELEQRGAPGQLKPLLR